MPAVLTSREVESLDDPALLASAARLLAESVPPQCAGLVPYHAVGYPRFLAAALAPARELRTVLVRGIRSKGHLHAVADWRLLDDCLFLNGVAVRAADRGTGLGGRLLRDGLDLARRLGRFRLALDVSLGNPGARALYQRFGFRDESFAAWVEEKPDISDVTPVRLLDWPAYAAHQAAYGFGDLRLTRAGAPVSVRIVGTALRLPPGASDLVAPLSQVATVSRSFTIRPAAGPDQDPKGFAHFARMSRPLPAGPRAAGAP